MRRPKHITAKQRTAASFNRAVVRRYLPLLAEALERYVADRFDEVRSKVGTRFAIMAATVQHNARTGELPDNPAEAVRVIAEEAGFDVDHEALDEWAAYAARAA